MKPILAISLFCTAAALFGCNTYMTTRVPDTGSARGYPFIFSKPYIATVTYTDGSKSVHVLTVPTLYAVDTERAALGTTKTEFENSADGFASKAKTDLDQKIPENLAAVTELLKALGVTVAGAPGAPGAPLPEFKPDILAVQNIVSIDVKPFE